MAGVRRGVRAGCWALVLLLVFLAGAAAGVWLEHQLAVDACLDGGGRWRAAGYCERPAPPGGNG